MPEAYYILRRRDVSELLATIITSGLTVASQPTAVRTVTGAAYTSSGTFAAGARRVTFVASSDFSGTLAGQPFAANAALTFVAPGNDTLGSIAYTRSAGTLYSYSL